MKKLLTTLFLLPLFVHAQTFVQKDTVISTVSGSWKMTLRAETSVYNKAKAEQLWIFFPGAGEAGTGYPGLQVYGFFDAITSGAWDGGVVVGGVKHYPILCAIEQIPDFPSNDVGEANVAAVIDHLIPRFNVKITAGKPNVMLTGLSAGGGTAKYLVTSDPYTTTGPWPRANRVTAIVDVQGVKWNANAPYPQLIENFARTGGRMASFEGLQDGRDLATTINQMNSVVANSGIYTQLGPSTPMQTHCCWNWIYGGDGNGTLYSSPARFTLDGINQNIYEWMYRQGDTTDAGVTNLNPVANAGSDQTITLPTDSVHLTGIGTDADGTIASYAWTKISGPGTTSIPNPNNQNVTASGLQEGIYVFRLTVTDNQGATATDDVQVTVNAAPVAFSYMTKNVNPCRSGGGLKFTIAASAGQIYKPYITRDNVVGQQVLGGDTIVLTNPGGTPLTNVEIGDFGGGQGCPVTVMTDSVIKYTQNFRVAIRDSNVVTYTHINGLANYASKGVIYGFQHDNSAAGYQDSTSIGFVANLVHHLEVDGISVINAGVGIMIKADGTSTNPYKQKGNFKLSVITLHDNYMRDIHGEGHYLGQTNIDGTQQGQTAPPPDGDTLSVRRTIVVNTGWDGLQVSNFNYGNDISTVTLYKTGQANISNQNWTAFLGGNSSNTLHNCASYNSTGPIGALGKGIIEIYNNYVDSVWDGRGDADGVYVNMSLSGMTAPFDSLQCFTYNNVIKNVERYVVNHANASGAMIPGQILSNTYVGTGGQFVTNVPGESLLDNISDPNYILSSINTDAYRMLQLVRANPTKVYSFYDLENIVPVINRFRFIKAAKIRLIQVQ